MCVYFIHIHMCVYIYVYIKPVTCKEQFTDNCIHTKLQEANTAFRQYVQKEAG